MFHILKSYLAFLWQSKNEHAVHSPFVFNLITKCFYNKSHFEEYDTLSAYRHKLLTNHNTIDVTDFGAGSRIFKSNKREIAQIAATAGLTKKRAELLFRVTKYLKPDTILEIGTSLGLASTALAFANTNATITTLEGCSETAGTANTQFEQLGIKNIKVIVTEFDTFLENSKDSTTYQMIYFDGNHKKEPTLNYFNLLLSTINNDTVWIFDDIHWSKEMSQAWEIIKKHPSVTVTIDTFQWGIVFFRKEQPKQHFVIRV